MNADEERGSLRSVSISMASSPSSPSETVDQLKELLRQESRCHEETGNCYNTLQKEYDDLLRKHAEAENIIDKLRVGARIKLYYDPKQGEVPENEVFPDSARSKSTQLIHLAQPQKAHLSRTHSMPDRIFKKRPGPSSSFIGDVVEDKEAELASRIQTLQNDVTNFQNLLSEGECSLEEQKRFYDSLNGEYDDLKKELKVLDSNEKNENQTSSDKSRNSDDFVGTNSLQAEVYRLGLRLEEIDEEIGEQIRNQNTSNGHIRNNDNDLSGRHGNNSSDESMNESIGESEVTLDRSDGQQSEKSGTTYKSRFERDNSKHHNEDLSNSMKPHHSDQRKVLSRQPNLPGQNGPEVNPKESGYFTNTGRSQPIANGFEEKYLSRSLNRPPTAYSCAETEERVGSWVSKSNKSAHVISPNSQSGHRRRTKSSEVTSMKSNSTRGQRRRRSQTLEEPRNSKSITPDTGRPFTNNSTEDSGFLDADHRSHISRGQSIAMLPNRHWDGVSLSQRRSVVSPTTAGEQYRDRLDSLHNFVQTKRQKNEKLKQTPRSWVRGKSPSIYSLPFVESNISTQDNFETPVSPVLVNKTTPRGGGGKEHSVNTSRHSPFKLNKDEGNMEFTNSEKIMEPHSPQENALETLQHEMHDIRDLVLDLKSSLHVKSNTNERDRTLIHTPSKSKTFIKRRESSTTKESPKNDDILYKKQMKMFEKLNGTMERLSSKIEEIDKQRKDSPPSSVSEKSYFSGADLYDENFNPISKLDTSLIPHLQHMSKRVEDLQQQMSERDRQQKLKECDNALLIHQSGLVKNLESKLSSIEKRFEPSGIEKRLDHSKGLYTSHLQTPSCPLCGSKEVHSHHEEYIGFHSTPAGRRDSSRIYTSSKKLQRTPPKDSFARKHISGKSFHEGELQITPPRIIHHYHSFCGNTKEENADDRTFAKSFLTAPRTPSIQHATNAMDSDNLYDSINSATQAAKRMENLSKKMLSSIAADLFNADEMVEY